jgi:hypothetical protein
MDEARHQQGGEAVQEGGPVGGEDSFRGTKPVAD